MNKKSSIIVAVIVGALLIGGSAIAYNNNQNDKKEAEHAAMMKKEADTLAMQKEKDADAIPKDHAMAKDSAAMMVKGSFTDYDQAKLVNAEHGHVVLFFSASWCPTCKEANKNFTSTATPDGLTLLKLDYDNSTELKQKYGVTYQHTFVQVDKNGTLIKKWSGSTTYDQIKSELQ